MLTYTTTPEHAGYGPRITLPEFGTPELVFVYKMLNKLSKWGGSDKRFVGVDFDSISWEFTTANAHVAVAALDAMGFKHKEE